MFGYIENALVILSRAFLCCLIVSTEENSGKIIATAKLWTDDYRRSYTVKYYRTLTQTPDGETVKTTRKITFDTMTLTEDTEQLVGKSIPPLGGRATAFCKPFEEVQKYLIRSFLFTFKSRDLINIIFYLLDLNICPPYDVDRNQIFRMLYDRKN